MTTVSYSELRTKLAHYLDAIENDAEEIIVSRGKGRKAVILSLREYSSLLETAYLLSTKKNRAHLERSLDEIKKGKTVVVHI